MQNTEFEITEVSETREQSPADTFSKVLVASVASKNTAPLLKELNDCIPLQHFSLGHLKRARKLASGITEIILFPESYAFEIRGEIREIIQSIRSADVSKLPPETTEEFLAWGVHWPIHYRPNERARQIGLGLTYNEMVEHVRCMKLAILDGDNYTRESCLRDDCKCRHRPRSDVKKRGAIAVDPATKKVVMASWDAFVYICGTHSLDTHASRIRLLDNPLFTPVMLCAEGVAASIRGDLKCPALETILAADHYLCSGLDMYVVNEPDIMDSMALIHCRINRVFYTCPDLLNGGVGSQFYIHNLRALNHHFRVYRMTRLQNGA